MLFRNFLAIRIELIGVSVSVYLFTYLSIFLNVCLHLCIYLCICKYTHIHVCVFCIHIHSILRARVQSSGTSSPA